MNCSLCAPLPTNEVERLLALRRYGVLDTPKELIFDRLTRIAAKLFKTPIALLSFVDQERQFIKSNYGLDIQETPRDVAFCAYTILSNEVLIVPDTQVDQRFAANPLVTGAPGIRFYVGAPLKTHDGFCLGSLCIIDTVPHAAPTQRELVLLEDLAAEVVEQLEFRVTKRELSVFQSMLERREHNFKEHQAYRLKNEYRAALALEAANVGVWEWDAATDQVAWSTTMEEIFGLAAGSYQGTYEGWLRCVHPEDRSEVANIRQFHQQDSKFDVHYRIMRSDGEVRWIREKGAYQCDNQGNVLSAFGICFDITADQLEKRELQYSRK